MSDHPSEHSESTSTKSLAFTTIRLDSHDQRTRSVIFDDPVHFMDIGTLSIQQAEIVSGSDPGTENPDTQRTFDEDLTTSETWRRRDGEDEEV
jgi:hypothetical protein